MHVWLFRRAKQADSVCSFKRIRLQRIDMTRLKWPRLGQAAYEIPIKLDRNSCPQP